MRTAPAAGAAVAATCAPVRPESREISYPAPQARHASVTPRPSGPRTVEEPDRTAEGGSRVRFLRSCYPTTGSWYSPYDGATWTVPSDVDIDHVVPLAEAWRSGASNWTTSKRRSFANDLSHPQLIC